MKTNENKSEDDLIKILSEPKTIASLSKKTRDIRKDFNELRDKFLKPKIKEIRKNLYEMENKKNLSVSKTKVIEKNLFELQKILSKLKSFMIMMMANIKG